MDCHASPISDFLFFKKNQELSQTAVLHALSQERVILMSRKLFATKEEALTCHPAKSNNTLDWANKLRPWHTERRHVYLACYIPGTSILITSSAEPDKSKNPWPLRFCLSEDRLAIQDMTAIQDPNAWQHYNASAIILPKSDYPVDKISQTIQWFRENPPQLTYSIHPYHGYDCQAASRDILHIVNPSLEPKKLILPNETTILALHSNTTVFTNQEEDTKLMSLSK